MVATFDINRGAGSESAYRMSVEAAKYRQEGEYFVFYADRSQTEKVLTIKASAVTTIDTVRRQE